jgi:MFS family permease
MTLIVTFVIAFGLVKAAMNFVAGAMSERFGRKRVLIAGWLVALPIPFMIRFGHGWEWIVAATVLLGVNQGLTWSMTLTSKLDLTRPDQRGLVNGLNEFSGYFAVAVAGVVTGWLSARMGPRAGLFLFGAIVIGIASASAIVLVRETRPSDHGLERVGQPAQTRAIDVFGRSWSDRSFFAVCQAGLIEKFVDALMWVVLPVFLTQRQVAIDHIGWIPAAYTATWGVSQLFTGRWSDRVGRRLPIVLGMTVCGVGVIALPLVDQPWWWGMSAAAAGLGMGLLYPTLGAAVSDLAVRSWLGTALGVYRFWRDLGYAIGGLALGLVLWNGGSMSAAFMTIWLCMIASGALVAALLNPAIHDR